jgi:hypothetical protein
MGGFGKMHIGKNFGYLRMVAKSISLPFIVLGVFLFIVQILPVYVGRGVVLWVFIGAGLVWALDTLWNVVDDVRRINARIR